MTINLNSGKYYIVSCEEKELDRIITTEKTHSVFHTLDGKAVLINSAHIESVVCR